MHIVIGIFIILHGLVHIWYVVLSQRLIEFQSGMGWTGKSWLLSGFLSEPISCSLATVFYSLSSLLFLIAGIGVSAASGWYRQWLLTASMVSILSIIVFWDGDFTRPVEKGLIGLLIDVVIFVVVFRNPNIV